jgi:hypothetical protein
MPDLKRVTSPLIRKLLKFFATISVLVLILLVLGFARIYYDGYSARKMSSRMQVGMTIDEVMARYPKGLFNSRVFRATRKVACRTESGTTEPPDGDEESGRTPVSPNSLKPCEPIESITVWGPGDNDRFAVEVHRPGRTASESMGLSREEFSNFLRSGFSGREFRILFQYRTHGPYHLESAIWIGKDGKINKVGELRTWD